MQMLLRLQHQGYDNIRNKRHYQQHEERHAIAKHARKRQLFLLQCKLESMTKKSSTTRIQGRQDATCSLRQGCNQGCCRPSLEEEDRRGGGGGGGKRERKKTHFGNPSKKRRDAKENGALRF